MRRRIIKKRKQRHQKRIQEREQRQWAPSASRADQDEIQAIQDRFGSLSVLGRYCNPFPEWREQGAWEFVVWKTWYVLTTGKLWSDGGVGKARRSEEGKQRILETLPSTTPSWQKYKKSTDNSGVGGGAATPTLDEESWDKLSKSELTEKPGRSSSPSSSSDSLRYTWIGQSTMLLSYADLNILTDPVFGVQPVPSIFSPTRITPQPCTIADLVANVSLDVVVVSHNHYDHFDADVVPHIPEHVTWVVPLGMRGLLTRCGKERQDKIVELDWWEMRELQFGPSASLRVKSIPAMHWSARTPLDTNQSLWTSYSLQIAPKSKPLAHVYFSGDTGYSPTYFPHLAKILSTPQPLHLAFIPIGSYEPRWHMSPQHIGPADAIAIAKDIRARKVVGMHWGTWIMSDEQFDEPPKLLAKELQSVEKSQEWFGVVKMGETNELAIE